MRRVFLVLCVLVLAAVFALPPLARRLAPPPAAVPPPERSVAIDDGLALNVRDTGSGSVVVLVHGLPSNIGDWADVPDRLAALGHRVVVYDRVGYGHSSRAAPGADAYTLPANARQLAALLDALAIERASWVGWSYGGGIVQTLAVAEPARVDRLVLLASVGPVLDAAPESDPIERLAESPIGPALFRWVTSVPQLGAPIVGDALAVAFSGAEHVPPGFAARTRAQLALPGTIDAWIAESRNGGYGALRPEAIAAPSLVLHGTLDRSVGPGVGEDLAHRLPDAKLDLVEGGSHMLPVTHAALVAERIHEWVSGR